MSRYDFDKSLRRRIEMAERERARLAARYTDADASRPKPMLTILGTMCDDVSGWIADYQSRFPRPRRRGEVRVVRVTVVDSAPEPTWDEAPVVESAAPRSRWDQFEVPAPDDPPHRAEQYEPAADDTSTTPAVEKPKSVPTAAEQRRASFESRTDEWAAQHDQIIRDKYASSWPYKKPAPGESQPTDEQLRAESVERKKTWRGIDHAPRAGDEFQQARKQKRVDVNVLPFFLPRRNPKDRS